MTVQEIARKLEDASGQEPSETTDTWGMMARWVQKFGQDEYLRGRREVLTVHPWGSPGQGSKL